MDYKPDVSVNVAVGSISAVCISITVLGYLWMAYQYRQNHWHHGVRLPSLPERHHWYQVALSIGCRPWAGHEGDVFIRLIGSKAQGNTFLINNEAHSRLYEAESQMFLYASARPLGEIKYVIIVCGATQRRKRFFLSSIQVKYVTNDPVKDRYWYFPYHEWIEVFLEPVKVTLCGVDPHHDINKRLLLGWLSRGVSDFHLWLSMLGPLKYTRFRRAERLLCSGAHAAGSIVCCIYLNGLIPNLGRVVLGIFSSASAAASVYVIEWCLRMTNRQPKVVIEEISWYRDKKGQKLKRILSYDQFRKVVANNDFDIDKIVCKRANEDSEIRRKEFEAYRDIMKKEHVFWRWITDGGRLEVASFLSLDAESYVTADESLPFMTQISIQALKCCMKTRAILKVLFNWIRGKAGHGPYAEMMRGDYDVERYQVSPYGGKIAQPKTNIIAEMIKAAKAASQQALPTQAKTAQAPPVKAEKWQKKWIDLNQKNFHGEPNLLWRVDSQYSIFSLEMEGVDFDRFSLIESMPVADFDLLREGKRPLLGWLNEAESQYFNAMGDSSHIENHVYRKLVPKVKPILLPPSVKRLTHEEGQLVCMIYFDLLTKGYQWCNPGVPDQLFDQRNTEIRPCTDWMKLDIASKQDLTGNWKPIDFKGRSKKNRQARETMTEMNRKYPEPIPKQRVFSMLMFPEYAKKLSDAYDEMLEDPEMHSCMSEMFAMFAESKEGPLMFGEACLQLSQYDTGRQAICHLLSAARKSPAWAQMILDLAQRLRFQGDNIKRIREKYGLQADCHIKTAKGEIPYEVKCFDAACDEDCKPLKFDRRGNLICDTKIKSKCIYYELDRMTAWNKKLAELKIPQKECPMGQLPQSDITKLSRFFRAMVLSEDGCMMFSELILQVNAGGRQGADSIARVLRFVTQAEDGVKRLIGFHREIGESGKLGRRLLLRWYNAVKRQPPHGCKILQQLADHLATIPLGRMLIEDLQVDGKKAHMVARQIKSEIHQHLDPFVKSTARNLKHTILRLNEMARSLLSACDHAKSVLDGEGELPFKTHMETKLSESAEKLDDAAALNDPEYGTNAPPWMSKITCCRNYKELVAKLNAENKKPPSSDVEKPDDFPWTPDNESLSCIYANAPKESDKPLSKRWVPIDDREKINIYQRESPSQKLLRERMLKLLAAKKKASKIKKGDCTGFNAPCCKRLDYCLARERAIYNQFFLQTKDYETFYMNFSFRPTGFRQRLSDIEGRLGGDGAFSIRSVSSLEWEANKSGYHQNPMYYGRDRKWEELESAAEKWGRRVVYDDNGDDNEPEIEPQKDSIKPCVCKHGKCIYTCLVCSIARQITETKDPKKMVSIVTDNTKGAPQVSTSDLQPFPDYEDVVLAKPIRPTEIEHNDFAKQQFRQSLAKEKASDGRKDQMPEKHVERKKSKDSQSRRRTKETPNEKSSWKINIKQGLEYPRPNPSAKAHVSEYVITPAQNVRVKRGKLHISSISTASSSDTSSTTVENHSSPEISDDEEKEPEKQRSNIEPHGRKSSPPSPDCCRNKRKQCFDKHDDSPEEKADEGTEKKEEEKVNKLQLKLPGPCRLDAPKCPCDITKEKQKEIMERRDKARHAEEARKAKREENQAKRGRKIPPFESEDDGERHCPRLPFPSAGYGSNLQSYDNDDDNATCAQIDYYSEISEIDNGRISDRSTITSMKQLEDKRSPFPSSGCCKNKFEAECPCIDETERSKHQRRNKHASERILAMYTKQEADNPDPDKDNLFKLNRTGCGKDCIGKVAKAPGRPYPITAKNFKTVENAKNPLSPTAKKALELIKERERKEMQMDNGYVKPKNAGVDFLDGELESESDGLSDPTTKMMEEIEYCQVCGGVVSLKRVKDLTYAYRYFVKRQGDDTTPDESMSNLTFSDDVSDTKINWEQAMGCCRRPGCRNKLPKGTHFRRIPQREKEEREKRYWENKKKLEKDMFNRFLQWLPPGKHSLPNAKDKEILEFAPDIDGAYHSDSYVTAVSCFRAEDSSESNSIDSMDKLVRSVSKRPVISRKAKLMKFRQFLNQTCDLHKLPRFACCRLHDSKWMNGGKGDDEKDKDEKEAKYMKNFAHPPLSCICNKKSSVSPDNDSEDASAAHSICSECHIRIGTQQRPQPPCARYLLPLKAVRCYEEALKAHADEKNQKTRVRAATVMSDSGLETAIDVVDSDDMCEINNVQNQTLLDLMGLSKRPGPRVKTFAGHLSPASSYVSLNSTLQSSGVCCHVNRARRLPILHLQGYGCDNPSKFPFGDGYQPLSIEWWKEHDSALCFVQECADACVRFRVLVARSREEALTDHEKTCKVCVPHSEMTFNGGLENLLPHDDDGIEMIGGTVLGARYSEMLPVVWRPQVREDGMTDVPLQIEKRRIRFYRQLIQAVVESTRMLILTPDIIPPKSKSKTILYQRQTNDFGSSDTTDTEATATSGHVIRLSHYRAMTKSFNGLLKAVYKIKNEKFVKPNDIQQAAKIVLNEGSTKKCLEMCSAFELSEDNRAPFSIVDALTEYMKGKMCGAVDDCQEVLSFPWDIPIKQQQVTGRFLSGLVDRLREEDEDRYMEEVPTDDALETIIESYIGEAIFKATTQLHIQQAVIQAFKAKQYLAYLNCITKMCVSKLVRYGSVVEYALGNTKKVVKSCLEAVDTKVKEGEFNEGWWKDAEKADPRRQERHAQSLLYNGRDESNSTLDDVIIGFERLRRYVRYDLQLAEQEVRAIAALADKEAMELFHGASGDEIPERKPLTAYDAWTESEVILRENRRLNSCEKLTKAARAKEKSESEKDALDGVETTDAGVTESSARSSDGSQVIRVICPADTSQSSLASRYDNTNSSKRLREADESAPSATDDSSRSRSTPTPIHYDTDTFDGLRSVRMTNLSNQDIGKPTILKRHYQDTSAFDKAIESTAIYENTSRRLHRAESEIIPTKMMLKNGFMQKDPTSQPQSKPLKKDQGYLSDNKPSGLKEEFGRLAQHDQILETIVLRDKDLKISKIVTRESPILNRSERKDDSDVRSLRSLQPSAEPPPLMNSLSRSNSPVFVEELSLPNADFPDDKTKNDDISSDDVITSNPIHSSVVRSFDIMHDHDTPSPDAISFVTCLSGGDSFCGSEELNSQEVSSEETNPPASSSSQDDRLDGSMRSFSDSSSIRSIESKETNEDSKQSEAEEETTTDNFQEMIPEEDFLKKKCLPAASKYEDDFHSETEPKKTASITVLFSASNTELLEPKKEVEPKFIPKRKRFVPATRTISVACSLKSSTSDSSFLFSSQDQTNSSSVSLPDLRSKALMEVQFNTPDQPVEHGKVLRPSTGVVPYRKTVRSNKPIEDRLKKRSKKRKHAHAHRYGSVFGQLMSTEDLPTEGHTKKVLQSQKGKNMLEEVFGKPKSPKEQMNAYHHNIRTLLRSQNGQFLPFWTSQAMQILLFAACVGSAGWTLFLAFYNESIVDSTLYWSVPIAIVAFGFVIEPLKCLTIAWILFLRRKRPAFYNSPLFIKTNPAIMIRSSAMRSKTCGYINRKDMSFYEKVGLQAEDYEEGLYRQYCENRSRPDCGRHQRRKLPALGESNIALDFEKIPTFAEIEEAKFTPYMRQTSSTIVPADDMPQEAESGFRRGALDIGVEESKAGFRREAVDRGGSRDVQRASNSALLKTNGPKRSSSDPSAPLSARIVWCNFATSDEGKPMDNE